MRVAIAAVLRVGTSKEPVRFDIGEVAESLAIDRGLVGQIVKFLHEVGIWKREPIQISTEPYITHIFISNLVPAESAIPRPLRPDFKKKSKQQPRCKHCGSTNLVFVCADCGAHQEDSPAEEAAPSAGATRRPRHLALVPEPEPESEQVPKPQAGREGEREVGQAVPPAAQGQAQESVKDSVHDQSRPKSDEGACLDGHATMAGATPERSRSGTPTTAECPKCSHIVDARFSPAICGRCGPVYLPGHDPP